MADVDLSAERITVVPAKAVGVTKGLRWTKDQCLSSIELGFDFRDQANAYLGSSMVSLSDGNVPSPAWEVAKALAVNPAKSAEDLVATLVGTEWGRALLANRWRVRDIVQVVGK